MTVTRYYLSPNDSGVSVPSIHPGWEKDASLTGSLVTTPSVVPMRAGITDAPSQSVLLHKSISEPLSGGLISGTMRAVFRTETSWGVGVGSLLRVVIRLVSGDGTVERGVLAYVQDDNPMPAFTAAASRAVSISMTPQTAQPGDRLVLEVGGKVTTTETGHDPTVGNVAAVSYTGDLPFADDVTTNDLRSWVELDIPFVPGSGSRLYFPNALAAPAGVTPAYDASWGVTSTAVRRKLMHKPTDDGGINHSRSVNETSATPINGLVDQYISDPLPFNKTISGSVLASVKGRGGGGTAYLRIVVKVISNTGTIKATLFSGVSNDAYGSAAPFYTCVVGGNLTPFDALAGDRIVVERGAYFNNTTTTSQGVALSVNTDYNYPDGASTFQGDPSDIQMTRRPWIEFSQPDVWGPPKPTIASEPVAVVEQPVRTPTRLTSTTTVVGEQPVRTPTRLSGIIVNALVPRAGQISKAIYAAGFPTREPRVKLPDGRWVPLRPAIPAQNDRPVMAYSNHANSRSIELLQSPASDEFLVLTTTSKDIVPKSLLGPPSGIPGVTWDEVYRSLDDRHVVWFGTGATDTGTISIPFFGSDSYQARVISIFVVKGAKKNLAHWKGVYHPANTPAVFTPEIGARDQISFVSAVAHSSNPSPVIVKPMDWITLIPGNPYVVLGKANSLEPTDPTQELSIAQANGIAGQLVVLGGKEPYVPPVEGLPITETVRYYMQAQASSPVWSPYSSKWTNSSTASNYYIGMSTSISPEATGNIPASKPSVLPNSVAGGQMSFPPLRAGVIDASFRFVGTFDYIGEAYPRIIIRLVSSDGQTIRGELADITSTKNADAASGSVETITFSGPLAPLVAERGDRIIAEVGFHFVGGLGGGAYMSQMVAATNGDYPFQDGVVYDNTKRAWFELIPN